VDRDHWATPPRPHQTARAAAETISTQVELGGLGHLMTLEFVDLLLGCGIVFGAGFDFDEHDGLSIPRNDVEFAHFAAEVADEDPVTQPAEELRRRVLAALAEHVRRGLGLDQRLQPREHRGKISRETVEKKPACGANPKNQKTSSPSTSLRAVSLSNCKKAPRQKRGKLQMAIGAFRLSIEIILKLVSFVFWSFPR
jgi:hypothetical protein